MRHGFYRLTAVLACLVGVPLWCTAAETAQIEYETQIAPIFTKYCTGCHNDLDLEGGLSLESFASLQEGGSEGVALLPGQSDSSRLVRVLTGEAEPAMPPDDNPPPAAEEIELLRAWIDAGAKGPQGKEIEPVLIVPYVPPREGVVEPITALALSPDGAKLAVGRFQRVDVLTGVTREQELSLEGIPGKVNSVSFSKDGAKIIVASGTAGLRGTAIVFDAASGEKLHEVSGHRDTLYDAVLSADGTRLATCSYNHDIVLWDIASGERVLTLTGHNGAVFDLAFSPDGGVLASASADETLKLWRVRDGARLDTLSQPQGEQYAAAFSPDGRYVVGGGADNRIRVWRFVSREEPEINPLVYSRFAHEGAVVDLAFSHDGRTLVSAAEDRTLKAWQTTTFTETQLYEPQPDVVTSLDVSPRGRTLVVGRMDGTWHVYPVPDAEADAAVHAPAGTAATTQLQAITAAAADDVGSLPMSEITESEPNGRPQDATPLEIPARIRGVVHATEGVTSEDADLFRFHSAAGEQWMIEVLAERQESPLDSFVEVLDAEGNPVERVLLQAVRDSYFTFRGKDSFTSDDFRVHNWEEMTLNQYLYARGEVVKLWHYPRGPDSGFMVYPGAGDRYTYFGTTPLSHALGEPCYIVEPYPPGTELIPNGLPVFTIYYENDDDPRREWGADSRLLFTAPRDGDYLVRVTDARGFSGEDFRYELTVRPRQPDFDVALENRDLAVAPGSGKEFRLTARRRDGFEGPIQVEIRDMPEGFSVTSPLVIEAGQIAAYGIVSADAGAKAPAADDLSVQITATARIGESDVRRPVESFSKVELADDPQVLVQVLPVDEEEVHSGNVYHAAPEGAPPQPKESLPPVEPLELTVAPGETLAARVRIVRRGFDGDVSLGGADAGRNLPHGVYVDNIGLNGLTILAGQSERIFFITADDWVPEQTRTFHLKAGTAGNPTSQPVILHVKQK